jgi:hypothetical protein
MGRAHQKERKSDSNCVHTMSFTRVNDKEVICDSCVANGVPEENCTIRYTSFQKHHNTAHGAYSPSSTLPAIAMPSTTQDLTALIGQMTDLKAEVLVSFFHLYFVLIHRHQNIVLKQEIQNREDQFNAMVSPLTNEDDYITELCVLLRRNARLMCEFKNRLGLVDASGTTTPMKRALNI